jgi:MFS family permease
MPLDRNGKSDMHEQLAQPGAASEFRRGWIIVLTAAVGLGCGLSALPIYTVGVFTKPLAAEFGWSRAESQAVYTWFTIGNLIAAPLLGHLIDHIGVRRIALFSVIAVGLGFASFGLFGGPLWSFYAIAFCTAIVGVGTVPITWTRVIVCWFAAGRGRALGIALAGTGVSATLLPAYTTWLLNEFGWRAAYIGIGALPIALALPLSLVFLKDQPPLEASVSREAAAGPPEPEGLDFGRIVRGYRFWALSGAFMLVGFSTAGLISHMIPMLTDRDMSPAAAAQVAGVIGMFVIAGRLVTGYLIDRYWAPGVALVLLNLPALACLLLLGDMGGVPGALMAAACIGLAAGAEFDLMAYLVSRYFGQRRYGITYSCLYAAFKIAAGAATPLFGLSFDTTGSYAIVLYGAIAGFLSASLLLLSLGRYPQSHGHERNPAQISAPATGSGTAPQSGAD